MQHLLEEKFFPYVIKPGRYTGGEAGQIVKPPENRLKFALGYPDMYEIGMSYQGLQILYHIVNSDDRFLCERFFAPDKDAEEIMRREKIPMFSLESFRPLGEFDVIGFTLGYEMVYTNMLNILDLAQIPVRAADRTDRHPLIIVGGPVAHNPEPTSAFIDLYYIGDAEENIIRILEIIQESKDLSRKEKLEKLVREVPSVYAPLFYDSDTGRPNVDFAPETIRPAHVKKLKREFYPRQTIVPYIETVHDRLTVEIMRGCPQACRFCQATAIYRPVRWRSREEIVTQVHEQLGCTGYDEVSLMSLSSSDYPEIVPLTMLLARELHYRQVALSFPSLRPGTFTQELADTVKMVRKTGLTFAPEAGTERLRAVIRKNITDKQLYDTVELAFKNGWNLIKLYFMIGLPAETDEDIDGIVRMIRRSDQIGRSIKGKKIINVTISPFSPKPHTPFQWDQQPSPEYIREKSEYIKRNVRSSYVNIKFRDPYLSFLEGILGRGGREMGDVIETAFKAGARFDGWGDMFDSGIWLESFRQHGINPHEYLRGRSFSENLPWSRFRLHVSADGLRRERNRTSTILRESEKSVKVPDMDISALDEDDGFGRSRKKAVQKIGFGSVTSNVRIRWGRKGLARFLSHRDNMRLLERAIRRAGIPAAFSKGFHPHMKMAFGPPLSVGFTSEAEYLDLTLERPFQPDMAQRISRELPSDFSLFAAQPIINTKVSLSGKLNRAIYEIPLDADNNDVQSKIDALMSRNKVEIDRETKDDVKTVDIRPAIYILQFRPSETEKALGTLYMELGIGTAGYARPTEVLKVSGIVDDSRIPAVIIHRKNLLFIDDNGRRLSPMEF